MAFEGVLEKFIEGFQAAQTTKERHAKQMADERFRQSELQLDQQRAKAEVQRLDQQLKQQQITNALNEKYLKLDTQKQQATEKHQQAQDAAAQARAETAAKAADVRATYLGNKLSADQTKSYIAVYRNEYDKAMAAYGDPGVAAQIAEQAAEFIVQHAGTKSFDPTAQMDPEFVQKLSQSLSQFGQSPKFAQDLATAKSKDQYYQAQVGKTVEDTKRIDATTQKIKTEIDLAGVRKNLVRAQTKEAEARVKNLESEIQKRVALLPLDVAKLKAQVDETISRGAVSEAERAASTSGPPSPDPRRLRDPRYMQSYMAAYKTGLQKRYDTVGKAKVSLEKKAEDLYKLFLEIEQKSKVSPVAPTDPLYRSWEEARKPGGLYEQHLKQLGQQLDSTNRQLTTTLDEYFRLDALAKDPQYGWQKALTPSGRTDTRATEAASRAAARRANQPSGQTPPPERRHTPRPQAAPKTQGGLQKTTSTPATGTATTKSGQHIPYRVITPGP